MIRPRGTCSRAPLSRAPPIRCERGRGWTGASTEKTRADCITSTIPSRCAMGLLRLRRVLSDAVAEGPVLLRDFHQADEHVLRTDAGRLPQELRDARVQRLLRFDGAAGIQRDLDEDH